MGGRASNMEDFLCYIMLWEFWKKLGPLKESGYICILNILFQLTLKSITFTPTEMPIIKKMDNNKCWQGFREIETSMHSHWECAIDSCFGKQASRSSKSYQSYHMVQLFYSQECTLEKWKQSILSKTCAWTLVATLFITDKKWKQPNIQNWRMDR